MNIIIWSLFRLSAALFMVSLLLFALRMLVRCFRAFLCSGQARRIFKTPPLLSVAHTPAQSPRLVARTPHILNLDKHSGRLFSGSARKYEAQNFIQCHDTTVASFIAIERTADRGTRHRKVKRNVIDFDFCVIAVHRSTLIDHH